MAGELDKAFADIDTSKVEEALGPENVPNLPPGELGRFRLVEALMNRFGKNFRSNRLAKQALKQFDDESQRIRGAVQLKEIINGERS